MYWLKWTELYMATHVCGSYLAAYEAWDKFVAENGREPHMDEAWED